MTLLVLRGRFTPFRSAAQPGLLCDRMHPHPTSLLNQPRQKRAQQKLEHQHDSYADDREKQESGVRSLEQGARLGNKLSLPKQQQIVVAVEGVVQRTLSTTTKCAIPPEQSTGIKTFLSLSSLAPATMAAVRQHCR